MTPIFSHTQKCRLSNTDFSKFIYLLNKINNMHLESLILKYMLTKQKNAEWTRMETYTWNLAAILPLISTSLAQWAEYCRKALYLYKGAAMSIILHNLFCFYKVCHLPLWVDTSHVEPCPRSVYTASRYQDVVEGFTVDLAWWHFNNWTRVRENHFAVKRMCGKQYLMHRMHFVYFKWGDPCLLHTHTHTQNNNRWLKLRVLGLVSMYR